jgi:hypothetical protein
MEANLRFDNAESSAQDTTRRLCIRWGRASF